MTYRSWIATVGTGMFLILALAAPAFGDMITFSTMQNNQPGSPVIPGHGLSRDSLYPAFTWNYTGNYTDLRLSTYILDFNNNNQITICTIGRCGSENYGFNRTYSGYEFIYFGFQLPANATNIAMSFIQWVDDRDVIDLNGHLLGAWGIYGYPGATVGHSDGSGDHLVTISGGNGLTETVSNQSWFNPGGDNYLRFWVNNTGNGISGNATPNSYDDPSALQTYGYISYDLPSSVPEPATLALLALGLAGLGFSRRRKD